MSNLTRQLSTRARFVLLSFALVCAFTVPAIAAQRSEEPLIIPAHTLVQKDVATLVQDIQVQGVVEGDVTSWTGDITVAGTVTGDVVTYAGHVTITANGRVGGNVLALDGGLQEEAGAHIAGQTLGGRSKSGALASLFDLFMPSSAPTSAAMRAIGRLLLGIVTGIFVVAFCLLVTVLWPHRTATAAFTLRIMPLRSLALGLLTTLILALLLLPLTAVLTATLIGLPVVAFLLVALHVPYVYGLAAFTQIFTVYRNQRLHMGTNRSMIVTACLLAVSIGLVTSITPLGGLALFYLLTSPGLGAAILCRGGLFLPRAR